jgi:hypothetical protein
MSQGSIAPRGAAGTVAEPGEPGQTRAEETTARLGRHQLAGDRVAVGRRSHTCSPRELARPRAHAPALRGSARTRRGGPARQRGRKVMVRHHQVERDRDRGPLGEVEVRSRRRAGPPSPAPWRADRLDPAGVVHPARRLESRRQLRAARPGPPRRRGSNPRTGWAGDLGMSRTRVRFFRIGVITATDVTTAVDDGASGLSRLRP